jgi:hypothetical protein
MSFTTVGQIKTKINGKLHGTSLAKVADPYTKFEEAAGNLTAQIDPYTTIRRYRIENALYDKVYNYLMATDLKGNNSIIDIRPIGERSSKDSIDANFTKQFDIKKERNSLAIEVINGVKTLRISKTLTPRTTLHRADSLTLEGAVAYTGDVTEMSVDTLDYVSANGSLRADLSGATGVGAIQFTLNNAIDLTTLLNLGALFTWINFSDATALNSITLKWGTNSSNYWSKTVTAPHDRTAFESNAWTLQRHDWNSATKTGTPDESAITWLEIGVNYDAGTSEILKVDNITASLGQAWEAIYYSDMLFRGTDGTWKQKPTADTDIVMLDNDSVNIFIYELMLVLVQEIKGKNMKTDYDFFNTKLNGNARVSGLYEIYETKYPSQAIPIQEEYYNFGEVDQSDDDND